MVSTWRETFNDFIKRHDGGALAQFEHVALRQQRRRQPGAVGIILHQRVVMLVGDQIILAGGRGAARPIARIGSARAFRMLHRHLGKALLRFSIVAGIEGIFAQPELHVGQKARRRILRQKIFAHLQGLRVLAQQIETPPAHEHGLRGGRGGGLGFADARKVIQGRLELAHAVADQPMRQQRVRTVRPGRAGFRHAPILLRGGLQRPSFLI